MKLSIDSLKEAGAFSGAPVEKQIKWRQGEEEYEATVYVRPLSYQAAMSDIASIHAKGDAAAGRIAASICDEEGKPVFTAADITGEADPERGALNHALTIELLRVIAETNSLGERRAKSPTKKKSSAS